MFSDFDDIQVSNNSIKEDSDISTSEIELIGQQLNIMAFESDDDILSDDEEEAFTSFSKLYDCTFNFGIYFVLFNN